MKLPLIKTNYNLLNVLHKQYTKNNNTSNTIQTDNKLVEIDPPLIEEICNSTLNQNLVEPPKTRVSETQNIDLNAGNQDLLPDPINDHSQSDINKYCNESVEPLFSQDESQFLCSSKQIDESVNEYSNVQEDIDPPSSDSDIDVNPKKIQKRHRLQKIMKVVKNHGKDVSGLDLGVSEFEKFYDALNPEEQPNIQYTLHDDLVEDYLNTSKKGINILEYTFVLDTDKLSAINSYVNGKFGSVADCLAFFYKKEYRKHNNICIINFTGNQDRKKFSKYGQCAHTTCRTYLFKASGSLETLITVKVFVRPNFRDATTKYSASESNGIIHYRRPFAGEIRGIERKIHQTKLFDKAPHDFMKKHRVNVPMSLEIAGKAEYMSDER